MTEQIFKAALDAFQKYLPLLLKYFDGSKHKDDKRLSEELKIANNLYKSGKYEEALSIYKEIARKFPRSMRPILGEISVQRKQGRHLQAIAACGMALQISDGDLAREAMVYNTMGAVSVELFDIYYRKSDIDEAITFFSKARSRASDVLFCGNIVDSCLRAMLGVKKLSRGERSKYEQLALEELNLIIGKLGASDITKIILDDAKNMIEDIDQKVKLSQSEAIENKIMSIRELLNLRALDAEMASDYEIKSRNFTLTSRLSKALAGLAVVSMMAGFSLLGLNHGSAESKSKLPTAEIIENNGVKIKQTQEVWRKAGLIMFAVNATGSDVVLVREIHDWQEVKVREPDIDRMTA